jgi:site-specific DNA-adenine methylase
MIKSILRYPGGKSRVAHKLVSLIPQDIKEFREPMVGGGSVSLVLKQTLPHVKGTAIRNDRKERQRNLDFKLPTQRRLTNSHAKRINLVNPVEEVNQP